MDDADPAEGTSARLALALGGGAARGLAHIGVLEVLEREGIPLGCIAGSSMGGLIGALAAAGLRAREIEEPARRFQFPRLFVFGRTLEWEDVFPSVGFVLAGKTFERLATPLLATAMTGPEEALPRLIQALEAPPRPSSTERTVHLDPVCGMVVSASRARGQLEYEGRLYYFCSENCREGFARAPPRYVAWSPDEPTPLESQEHLR